ncbi:MAG TPA: heparinase II/III family protein, partial [Gemmatimonadales bacterium]|nr:heparinase II/III family protein [Gemmatimonadales bacterium]
GHPDRLHLTLHADGVHWLADPGTGSYVSPDLFWYRATLAHNAPRMDGASQLPGDAACEAFDAPGEWAWVRGRFGDVTRTVVAGPAYIVDVVELASRTEHAVELPWHFKGKGDVAQGTWSAGELEDEFVSHVERFVPHAPGAVRLEVAAGPRTLRAFLCFDGELLRAEGPGRPAEGKREPFYVVRATGRSARFVTVLEPVGESASVRAVRVQGSLIEVETATQGVHRHAATALGWEITTGSGGGRVRLAGARAPEPPLAPLLELEKPTPAVGAALRAPTPPPLDGSLDGFDTSEPLRLELEDQYRRSEEPYPGLEEFSAVAHAAWDDDALYLAVDVVKPELCFRPRDAPPLRLDNEPDDIHSDGLQVYLAGDEGGERGDGCVGYLIVPQSDGRGLRAQATSDTSGEGDPDGVRGAWRRTDRGYTVTFGIAWPEWQRAHVGGRLRFDLLVNEMLPGRTRRAGQLVWSGGNGWVFVRGDRQDVARMGVLELVG